MRAHASAAVFASAVAACGAQTWLFDGADAGPGPSEAGARLDSTVVATTMVESEDSSPKASVEATAPAVRDATTEVDIDDASFPFDDADSSQFFWRFDGPGWDGSDWDGFSQNFISCTDAGQCPRSSATPICDTRQGVCVGCLDSNDCPYPEICDTYLAQCICTSNGQCPSGETCDTKAHRCVGSLK